MCLSEKFHPESLILLMFTIRSRGARWPSGRAGLRSERSGVRYLPPPGCVLEQRHIYSAKSTGNTKEAVAPSRHDRKIVYSVDVKP